MQSEKNENQVYLKVQAKTWGRDSHGLFDYESNQVKVNILLPSTTSKLVRKRNDIKQVPENIELDIEERELCKIITDGSILTLKV
jgi:hypothetical protein